MDTNLMHFSESAGITGQASRQPFEVDVDLDGEDEDEDDEEEEEEQEEVEEERRRVRRERKRAEIRLGRRNLWELMQRAGLMGGQLQLRRMCAQLFGPRSAEEP